MQKEQKNVFKYSMELQKTQSIPIFNIVNDETCHGAFKNLRIQYPYCQKFSFDKKYHFRTIYMALIQQHLIDNSIEEFQQVLSNILGKFYGGEKTALKINKLLYNIQQNYIDKQYKINHLSDLMKILISNDFTKLEANFFRTFEGILKYKQHKMTQNTEQIKIKYTSLEQKRQYNCIREINKSEVRRYQEIIDCEGKNKIFQIVLQLLSNYLQYDYKLYDITSQNSLELYQPGIQNKYHDTCLQFLFYNEDIYILMNNENKDKEDKDEKFKYCSVCSEKTVIKQSKNTLCNPCIRKQCHICDIVQKFTDDICFNISCQCKYCYFCIKDKQKINNYQPFTICLSIECKQNVIPDYIEDYVLNYEQSKNKKRKGQEQKQNIPQKQMIQQDQIQQQGIDQQEEEQKEDNLLQQSIKLSKMEEKTQIQKVIQLSKQEYQQQSAEKFKLQRAIELSKQEHKYIPFQQPQKQFKDKEECSICFRDDVNTQNAIVPCGHTGFCHDCLTDLQNRNGICPICRTEIASILKLYKAM